MEKVSFGSGVEQR